MSPRGREAGCTVVQVAAAGDVRFCPGVAWEKVPKRGGKKGRRSGREGRASDRRQSNPIENQLKLGKSYIAAGARDGPREGEVTLAGGSFFLIRPNVAAACDGALRCVALRDFPLDVREREATESMVAG